MAQSRPMDAACALRLSPAILYIVIGLNFLRCIYIAFSMYLYRYERRTSGVSQSVPYLVTIGDAIASFLDEDDVYTKNLDLATKETFRKGWPSVRPGSLSSIQRPARWFSAASQRRWCITMSLLVTLSHVRSYSNVLLAAFFALSSLGLC
jgi:hypothetical protein